MNHFSVNVNFIKARYQTTLDAVSNAKLESSGFSASRSVSQGVSEIIKALPLLRRSQFANI